MENHDLKQANILIVDDQIANTDLLELVLYQFGFQNIKSISDSRLFFNTLEQFKPDIVLLDLMMPYMSGYDILECYQKKYSKDTLLPFLVLTSDISNTAKEKALAATARDFLNKPFDLNEINLRIRNLLEMRFLYLELETQNKALEQKVAEQTAHLLENNQQLEKANSELKVLEEAKLHFLKIISHEIRTPLNGIVGFTKVLKQSVESEQALIYLNYLEKSVERLENFAYQALLLTQLNAGSYKLATDEIDSSTMINTLVEKHAPEIARKQLSVDGNWHSNKYACIADKVLIEYLIGAIIDNAVKHAYENTSISIDCQKQNESWNITVSNIGPEISDNTINNSELPVFGINQKHIDKNTGLDLVLSKLIVKAYNGSIHFLPNKPTGVIVQIVLNTNIKV